MSETLTLTLDTLRLIKESALSSINANLAEIREQEGWGEPSLPGLTSVENRRDFERSTAPLPRGFVYLGGQTGNELYRSGQAMEYLYGFSLKIQTGNPEIAERQVYCYADAIKRWILEQLHALGPQTRIEQVAIDQGGDSTRTIEVVFSHPVEEHY